MLRPLAFILLMSSGIFCDVYLHNPRGSNNRLNENTATRANANRVFDSQVWKVVHVFKCHGMMLTLCCISKTYNFTNVFFYKFDVYFIKLNLHIALNKSYSPNVYNYFIVFIVIVETFTVMSSLGP